MNKLFLLTNDDNFSSIMKILTTDFTSIVNMDEYQDDFDEINSYDIPIYCSMKKARKFYEELNDDKSLIICSENAIIQRGKFINFYNYKDYEFDILFNGQSHDFVTGISYFSKNKTFTTTEITKVYFDEICDNDMNKLIQTIKGSTSPYDFLKNIYFRNLYIQKIDGDFYNLMGLPINKIKNVLEVQYNIKF